MKYRSVLTGLVIDIPSKVTSEYFELIEEEPQEAKPKKKNKKVAKTDDK